MQQHRHRVLVWISSEGRSRVEKQADAEGTGEQQGEGEVLEEKEQKRACNTEWRERARGCKRQGWRRNEREGWAG